MEPGEIAAIILAVIALIIGGFNFYQADQGLDLSQVNENTAKITSFEGVVDANSASLNSLVSRVNSVEVRPINSGSNNFNSLENDVEDNEEDIKDLKDVQDCVEDFAIDEDFEDLSDCLDDI